MASPTWEFWRISRRTDGALEWLGATRPGSRVAADRDKVWTLVPRQLKFVANWYVTDDRSAADCNAVLIHEWIEVAEARAVALRAPDPTPEQLTRLVAPEAVQRLGRIDRYEIEPLLGVRVASLLARRS